MYRDKRGNPLIPDYYTLVGFNQIPDIRRVTVLGNNPSIDTTSTPEDIWTGGGLYPWLSSVQPLEAVSANTADTAAGTGARTVLVTGLDSTYAEISETVTLSGTTPVPLVNQFLRINQCLVMTSGTTGTNQGNITIQTITSAISQAVLQAGYGFARQAVYTVPAGHTLSIHSSVFSLNRTTGVDKVATVSNFIKLVNGTYRMPLEFSVSSTTPYRHDGVPGIVLPEKVDFTFRCNSVSSNNTDITAGFLAILIKNTLL